ncbi:MAG TPA: FlgD immunoglobulin-like domain containing protein [Gaiellaceae bacterium]|nr:FlgD immunoglobulin-like domain containing protein [Gaiellaceae bacterium]
MAVLRILAVALAAAALPPGVASAADRFVVRDEPVPATGGLRHPARAAPIEFDLVGLHWKGRGKVSFRTAAGAGAWSPWRLAAPEPFDSPDAGSSESRARRGWTFGSPYWTGPATSIQYRLDDEVTRLRAYFVWSEPSRPVQLAPPASARSSRPSIIRRAQWGADESIVRAAPAYASAVHFAVVHHTAGTNSYSASQSAAIVRGIERYHVLANGWNDIGYNFLVDKYGQIFEGRAGGIDRDVVGAHAQGFNTGSTGVAVLGTYGSSRVSRKARAALVRLLAWRLDVSHVNPRGRLTWISGGNPAYPAGTPVKLRAVSGHRDTGPTSCPGSALYAQLPEIARDVAARGLPKLYDPVVSGSLGAAVRFTAELSSSRGWTVSILDGSGTKVAGGSGTGKLVDWTWDASAIPFGDFTYEIEAGTKVRPAEGRVPGPPELEVKRLKVRPRAFSPNGDGVGERATLSYSLSIRASVKAEVFDSSARLVRSLVTAQSYRGGTRSLTWSGTDSSGDPVPDGEYRIRLTATAPGQRVTGSRKVMVDRSLGYLDVSPAAISPNADGRADAATVSFLLARRADVRVRIMDGDRVVKYLQRLGSLPKGRASFVWNGKAKRGHDTDDGVYRVQVEATTAFGTRTLAAASVVDTRAPVVRILSGERKRNGHTRVRLWSSEPARIRVRWGSPDWASGGSRSVRRPAGSSRVTVPRATRVRLQGIDGALNVGRRVIGRI